MPQKLPEHNVHCQTAWRQVVPTADVHLCLRAATMHYFYQILRAAKQNEQITQICESYPFIKFSRILLKMRSYTSWLSETGRFTSIRTVKATELLVAEGDTATFVSILSKSGLDSIPIALVSRRTGLEGAFVELPLAEFPLVEGFGIEGMLTSCPAYDASTLKVLACSCPTL